MPCLHHTACEDLMVEAFTEAIEDATGSHACTFNGRGLTVQNGGIYIESSDGSNVLWCGKNGFVKLEDLELGDTALRKGSWLYMGLANMEEISIQSLKASEAVIPDDTYISGFGGSLKEFIEHVVKNM